MRRNRALWMSIFFVGALVLASVVGYIANVRPVLGLDLEGGVSVILKAPSGTPHEVMNQALENIRNRIDAFGTAEPQLFVSGTTIEVQIPGLARGTIQERPINLYCVLGTGQVSYGCQSSQSTAKGTVDGATVTPVVQSVCLTGDVWNGNAPCNFATLKAAKAAIQAITVAPVSAPSPSPSGTGPGPSSGRYCLNGTGLSTAPCFGSKAKAQAALDGIGTSVTQNYCIQDASKSTLTSSTGTACFTTSDAANAELAALGVTHETTRYCVVSSANKNLGCFLTRDQAAAKLQATGQERLLQVIGQTARLQERQVQQVIAPSDPAYASTEVTCPAEQQRPTKDCSFSALRSKTVVFLGNGGEGTASKFKLGPVEVTGDMIKKATAVYNTGSQTSAATGWEIDFTLTSAGTSAFADVTQRLVTLPSPTNQLAIIVDNVVISNPQVTGAITTGSGRITGSFTEARAKDLATQLNAGALPVNLTTQQVLTVSPTLGKESLHQGLIAGIAGLIALALYLLFYYRLLGIVAWFGMSIWALLAFALISVAGRAIGYTLTLAGIAGLVISLGVTADSYIVFFERLKDEVRHGKSPRAAVQPAFKRAYRTIVAADIVTALAAAVLYLTAISSVRGFALTLGVATGLDLFVVYFFKRPVVFLIARNERLVNLHRFGLTSGVAAEPLPGEPLPVGGGSK